MTFFRPKESIFQPEDTYAEINNFMQIGLSTKALVYQPKHCRRTNQIRFLNEYWNANQFTSSSVISEPMASSFSLTHTASSSPNLRKRSHSQKYPDWHKLTSVHLYCKKKHWSILAPWVRHPYGLYLWNSWMAMQEFFNLPINENTNRGCGECTYFIFGEIF